MNTSGELTEGLMKPLYEFSDFVRRLRVQARFGRLSRAPLQLLRLELRGDVAECEWMARPPDHWDTDLPAPLRERNAASQALEDAIAVRDLLFSTLPSLSRAAFRVFRRAEDGSVELIITGTVTRDEEIPVRVASLAMRAKLSGFRFWLDNGQLRELQLE
jgi:hypothetical protein